MTSVLFRSILSILSLASLAACGANNNTDTEAGFQQEWADAWCDRQAACAKASYEADWTDHDACVQDRSDSVEFASFWGDLVCGSFDPDSAADCVRDVRAGTCEDWADETWRDTCDRVYGC